MGFGIRLVLTGTLPERSGQGCASLVLAIRLCLGSFHYYGVANVLDIGDRSQMYRLQLLRLQSARTVVAERFSRLAFVTADKYRD